MFLTMVISGLWHGAAWTFIIWGAVHALGRFCTRELEATSFYKEKVPKILKQIFVFIFVTFAWIFFRAESIGDAWIVVVRMFTSGFADPHCPVLALALIFAVWLYQFAYESRLKWLLELRIVRIGIIVFMVLYLALCAPSSQQPFIYLQF
jgi:D-alanyl-lipoteichoic acid acyltransferase DltB (MBOAT superfamily)